LAGDWYSEIWVAAGATTATGRRSTIGPGTYIAARAPARHRQESGLETDTAKHLTPLIQGRASSFNQDAQTLVATWVALRATIRRYWTYGVGSGAHVLVSGLREVARDEAESDDGPRP